MYDPLYYTCYDLLFTEKDYRHEAETVLGIARSLTGKSPKTILDVGCGTGNHSMVFSEIAKVVGIDIDPGIIEIAQAKVPAERTTGPEFRCIDVGDLDRDGFDLAVSLFNVVNYIRSFDGLHGFFREIAKRLNCGGVFVFDCWNGVAALRDLPKIKESTIEVQEKRIHVRTVPTVDLMMQKVTVDNEVTISSENSRNQMFTFQYMQTLWTQMILAEALSMAGFSVERVVRWMMPDVEAEHDTWKIMFICRRR
jgi:SAM-dependent methyltransferase